MSSPDNLHLFLDRLDIFEHIIDPPIAVVFMRRVLQHLMLFIRLFLLRRYQQQLTATEHLIFSAQILGPDVPVGHDALELRNGDGFLLVHEEDLFLADHVKAARYDGDEEI